MKMLLSEVLKFVSTYWYLIAVTAVSISSTTYWIAQIYKIRKLRFEIQKLRKEVAESGTTKIRIASLNEIEEYGKRQYFMGGDRPVLSLARDLVFKTSQSRSITALVPKMQAWALHNLDKLQSMVNDRLMDAETKAVFYIFILVASYGAISYVVNSALENQRQSLFLFFSVLLMAFVARSAAGIILARRRPMTREP